MKTNTIAVIKFLQNAPAGVNFTATDVASALGLAVNQVNGTFTGAIQKKGLGVRVADVIELEDGKTKEVKYLQLTPEGLTLDLASVEVIA